MSAEVRCPECFALVTPADLELRSSRARCPECAKSFAVEVPEGWVSTPRDWRREEDEVVVDPSPFRTAPSLRALSLVYRPWRWELGVLLACGWLCNLWAAFYVGLGDGGSCGCDDPFEPYVPWIRGFLFAAMLVAPVALGVAKFRERCHVRMDRDALRVRFAPAERVDRVWPTRAIERVEVRNEPGPSSSTFFEVCIRLDGEMHPVVAFTTEHDAVFLAHELRQAQRRLVEN
ncbi:MAG: hypothetical protein R3B99_13685 [Polyangiales bacterium]